MARLIDADALLAEYDRQHEGEPGKARKLIEDAPTIDRHTRSQFKRMAVQLGYEPVVRKPVKGYEGYYEIDQFGRVFGCNRTITVDDNGRVYEKTIVGKPIKQTTNSAGYKVVGLTINGKTATKFVHRLVAEAFIDNPDNLPVVNHKDEDKTNNSIENLEWCTVKYNNIYGTKTKRQAEKIRGRVSEKRVPVIQMSMSGEFIAGHPSIAAAAESVGSNSPSDISACCRGQRKSHCGYKWEFDGNKSSYGERRENCNGCEYMGDCDTYCWKPMQRPPQSYCFVEALQT